MTQAGAGIRCEKLQRTFYLGVEEVHAVDGVSLEIPPGTLAVLKDLPERSHDPSLHPGVTLLSTGDPEPLARAAQRWLGLNVPGQQFTC